MGESGTTKDLLAELVKALRSSRTAPEQVDLPIFRPNLTDAKKWLSEIESIKNEFEWSDQQIIVRVGRFLTGVSKTWIENWSPEIKSWEVFSRDFLEAFPPKKILGELLLNAAKFNSDHCNTYEAYVFEKTALLRNLRVQWEEPDLVEIIVHGITERDARTTASNQNLKKISELISYLGSVPKRRREEFKPERTTAEERDPTRKRFRERENHDKDQKRRRPLTCYKCGKNGHIQMFCTESKKGDEKPGPSSSSYSKPSSTTLDSTCFFCAKKGHQADNCYMKKGIDKRRNVNVCSSGRLITPCEMIVDGIKMSGIIDTGADISLIAQRHVNKFLNKIEPCYTAISGLLPGHFISKQSLVSNFEMSGVNTDLTFVIVPDSFLEHDLLVGCNLYNDPDIVTITNHAGTKIIKNKVARVLNILPTSLDFELNVPDIHKLKLLEVLSHYDIVAGGENAVSCVNNATMHIRLRDEFIVNRSPYRLSLNERQKVQDIIGNLLANKIIQESESPFASPILLVKKKEGSYRLCVDYRELNRHTIKDRYPLPLIDDQLDRLGKGKVFTSLDMSSGFHQIPIDPESVHKTAFITPDGHFEYLRMPFGLANAPAVFQRAINKALGNLRNTIALVYLDDVLIPSETFEENLKSLKLVLEALKNAGFTLNLQKCHFFQNKLEYLGREVSGEGIRPGMRKVEALRRSPIPTTVKQVRQLMGLAGYFRKFIPEFASRTACISKLTKTSEPFSWTEDQESARKYIIESLTSRPLLSVFDPELPTELHTDASSIGFGGVLLQKCDGNSRVIGYFSKKTNKYEEKYHSYELETLAVVNSLRYFRVYLLGIHFTLVTDCNAIKSTAVKKDILPRIARWWVYMQDFTFDITYRKGSSLPHVDFLSRNPPAVIRRLTVQDNWLYIEQRGNNEVKKLLNDWKEGLLDKSRYNVKNGILHYIISTPKGFVSKPFVPRQSRLGLLRIFHDEQCHVGIDKTLDSIQRHFWFPRMRYFVTKYIKHCLTCAVKKTRSGPLQGFIINVEKPSAPMNIIHADCLGPLETTSEGHKHVLVLVDAFTKYCVLLPLKSVKADETRLGFEMFISLFGTPKQINMDAGKNFKNLNLPKYLDSLGISYHYTTPDVHRSNGQVERYMRTIMNLLRIETKIKSEWSSSLWKIQLVLNTTVQKSIKTTPLRALIGIESSTPLIQNLLANISPDLQPIRNLQLDRSRIKNYLDSSTKTKIKLNEKRRNTKNFKVGDFVLMHRDDQMHQGKLKYEFQGPYEILSITSEGRYEIRRVGKSLVTKAAKEQLRMWPSDWSMTMDMEELLENLENNEKESESDDEPNLETNTLSESELSEHQGFEEAHNN